MNYSIDQKKIFQFIEQENGNLIVEAVAGSGKTTTLTEISKRLPNQRILFCAFNRHIANELQSRLRQDITVSTIHSLGKACLHQPKIKPERYPKIIANVLRQNNWPFQEKFPNKSDYISWFQKLVNIGRCYLAEPGQVLDYGLRIGLTPIWENLSQQQKIQEIYQMILNEAVDSFIEKKEIDFHDMVWLPNLLELHDSLPKYDVVLVDEAQDLSQAQLGIVRACVASTGRVIAVGDRHQAIYAFAGADPFSMDYLQQTLQASTRPLRWCYRCPKNHVLLAQQYNPAIQPGRTDPGYIYHWPKTAYLRHAQPGDLVLCRYNKPLMDLAIALLHRRKPVRIRGIDLAKFIRNAISTTTPTPYSRSAHIERLRAWALQQQKLTQNPAQRREFNDRLQCALTLIDGLPFKTLQELQTLLDTLFSNNHPHQAIWLSSVHRAKGLEAQRVILLETPIQPEQLSPVEQQQEMNIRYVALTRSKNTLIIVNDDP